MNVELTLSTSADSYVIRNMYPLYLHDLSLFTGAKPNAHGILADDNTSSAAEQLGFLDIWWRKPDILFPFIIRIDDLPGGFLFVARPPCLPKGIEYVL